MTRDCIIETPDGFDCLIGGRRFGSWPTIQEARLGITVQRHRLAARAELIRIADDRIRAARRGLDTAKQDPRVALERIGFLRAQLLEAQRGREALDALTIPPAPAEDMP